LPEGFGISPVTVAPSKVSDVDPVFPCQSSDLFSALLLLVELRRLALSAYSLLVDIGEVGSWLDWDFGLIKMGGTGGR
jgi:hypothetical protein